MKELYMQWLDEVEMELTTLPFEEWLIDRETDEIDRYYELMRERTYFACLS